MFSVRSEARFSAKNKEEGGVVRGIKNMEIIDNRQRGQQARELIRTTSNRGWVGIIQA